MNYAFGVVLNVMNCCKSIDNCRHLIKLQLSGYIYRQFSKIHKFAIIFTEFHLKSTCIV